MYLCTMQLCWLNASIALWVNIIDKTKLFLINPIIYTEDNPILTTRVIELPFDEANVSKL